VLGTFIEPVVPIHKHISLFWIPFIRNQSRVSRLSYLPTGGPGCNKGLKTQTLTPQTKLQPQILNVKH